MNLFFREAEMAAVEGYGFLQVLFDGPGGDAEAFGNFLVGHAFYAAHVEDVAGAFRQFV